MSNLPKGWKDLKLGDICNFYLGLTYTPTYVDKGIPFLSVKDLKNNQISFENTKYISEEEFENSTSNAKPQKGDIVFGRVGTLGNPVIVDFDIPFCIFVSLGFIRVHDNIFNEFIKHWISSDYFMNQVDSQVSGSAQKNLNVGWLKNFKLFLPPLEEQKKIADILSTVDKKIAFVEENINATEELKKGLMQKLLTEGIGHTEFKDSELGRIPESWEVIPFIELADKNIKHSFTGGPFGSDLKSEHYTDIGVRVIQLQNIGDGYFINNDFVYVSEEKAELLKSCQIYPNDIILAKMAEPVARACLIPDFESKYVMCSDGIRLKVDNSKFNTEFIFYSINYDNFRKIAVARSNGTTRLRIGLSALKSIPILIPPLEEQKQIAEILSTVDKKLENLKEKKQSFEELKKGLMQKLLTGEVRV